MCVCVCVCIYFSEVLAHLYSHTCEHIYITLPISIPQPLKRYTPMHTQVSPNTNLIHSFFPLYSYLSKHTVAIFIR